MALTGAAKTAYQREYMRRRRARLASTKPEKPNLTTKAGQRAAIERSPVAKSVTADVVQSAREIFAVMTSEQRFGLATPIARASSPRRNSMPSRTGSTTFSQEAGKRRLNACACF